MFPDNLWKMWRTRLEKENIILTNTVTPVEDDTFIDIFSNWTLLFKILVSLLCSWVKLKIFFYVKFFYVSVGFLIGHFIFVIVSLNAFNMWKI